MTSWEHIPGWAGIQTPLGKTCESTASPAVVAGVAAGPVATAACGWGRAVALKARAKRAESREAQLNRLECQSCFCAAFS